MTAPAPQPARPPESTGIAAAQTPSLVVGIVGAIVCVVAFFVDRQEFFRAYLPSWIFWFEIVAGSCATTAGSAHE